ncbi:MAG TPA: DUF1573 domain-containing protein [Bryobacteraceae bacterium]|nr:DUF1573 domain-containing protein [Bryobacteraceae bacterium]
MPATAATSRSEVVEFGVLGVEEPWEHVFVFENKGPEPLRVADVQLTPPLVVTKMPVRVAPGQTGSIVLGMAKPRDKGQFEGTVVVNFASGRTEPLVYWVKGKIVGPIDFDPFPAFFISTQRGQPKTATLDITNYEPEPMRILSVESSGQRYSTKLEELKPGRHFRLSLLMSGAGMAGRTTDAITLHTTSRAHPAIQIQANTNLNERVHTFPDAVQFGSIDSRRPELFASLVQRVMVYQEGGKDFQIQAETDIPFLRVSTHQAHLKDRYEVRLELAPEKLKSGGMNGNLIIATNDPEFPRVTIPITGAVAGN